MSQFIYLLNAMEHASHQDNPSLHDYASKRKAVLEYVDRLESSRPEVGEGVNAQELADALVEARQKIISFHDLIKRLAEWFDDPQTQTAFSMAWIHGQRVPKEHAEVCGEMWDRARKIAEQGLLDMNKGK